MKIPDTIHVLGFTKNPEALLRTCREVERVGFKAEPFWNFPTPFTPFIQRNLANPNKFIRRNAAFVNSGYGHYAILKTAYELGKMPVFIVEDDCRFLKDVQKLRTGLEKIPDDADLVLLDSSRPGTIAPPEFSRQIGAAKDGWAKVGGARSAAAYICSEKCAKALFRKIEAGATGGYVRVFDQWFDTPRLDGCTIYCAVPNLAIQQDAPNPSARQSPMDMNARYRSERLDFNDYALW